jgi:hypothetical protein
MRPSSRPSLPVSELPVLDLDLSTDGKALVVCRDCGCWIRVRRGLVMAHNSIDADRRCPGSAQHLVFDMTAREWASAHAAALNVHRQAVRTAPSRLIHPAGRRATAVHTLVYPPIAPAVHQIAARRTAVRTVPATARS